MGNEREGEEYFSLVKWLAPIKKGSNKIKTLISGRGYRQYRNFNFDKIRPI
jgi:hypothetical protein